MVAELEKINNRYMYKIVKGTTILLDSKYSYTTKSDAIRGFQRFNSAVKRLRFNPRSITNIIGKTYSVDAQNLTKKLSRERIYIIDKKQRKMYYFIENINKINLIKPIKVNIHKEDGEYISSIENLHLFSYGESLKETIDELKYDLNELYNDLFGGNYELAKSAEDFKNTLSKHF